MNPEKRFLIETARAILAAPNLSPNVKSMKTSGGKIFDVDLRPYDPGPMIGSGGRTKFAIQTILAGIDDPNAFQLHFNGKGDMNPPKARDEKPSTGVFQDWIHSLIDYWDSLGLDAEIDVEKCQSGVVVWLALDERISGLMHGPIFRLVSVIGKAQGFRAVAHIRKIAA